MPKVSLDLKKVAEGVLGKLNLNEMLIKSIPALLPGFINSSPMARQALAQTGLSVDQLTTLFSEGAKEVAEQPAEYEVPTGGARILMRNWQAVTNDDLRSALEYLWDDIEMSKQADATADLIWHLMGKVAVMRQASAQGSNQEAINVNQDRTVKQ